MPNHDMLALHADDDVAVALRDLAPGPVRVAVSGEGQGAAGGAVETLVLRAAIPLGHKAARRDLPLGHHVRKYGAAIGEATAPIAAGEHAHVHNIRSLRARRTEETP